LNAVPLEVVAVNTGAVAEGVVLLNMIKPPDPVTSWTSREQMGVAEKLWGKVKVIVGEEVKESEPVVIVNWQLWECPLKLVKVAPVPHPVEAVMVSLAHAVPRAG
jgi:mRNA-degrading endonuclease toxin of MazEF toxin-antitoxin module